MRPVGRTVSRSRTTKLPSNCPPMSASATSALPRKLPAAPICKCRQPVSAISASPSTPGWSQAKISPLRRTSLPMTRDLSRAEDGSARSEPADASPTRRGMSKVGLPAGRAATGNVRRGGTLATGTCSTGSRRSTRESCSVSPADSFLFLMRNMLFDVSPRCWFSAPFAGDRRAPCFAPGGFEQVHHRRRSHPRRHQLDQRHRQQESDEHTRDEQRAAMPSPKETRLDAIEPPGRHQIEVFTPEKISVYSIEYKREYRRDQQERQEDEVERQHHPEELDPRCEGLFQRLAADRRQIRVVAAFYRVGYVFQEEPGRGADDGREQQPAHRENSEPAEHIDRRVEPADVKERRARQQIADAGPDQRECQQGETDADPQHAADRRITQLFDRLDERGQQRSVLIRKCRYALCLVSHRPADKARQWRALPDSVAPLYCARSQRRETSHGR